MRRDVPARLTTHPQLPLAQQDWVQTQVDNSLTQQCEFIEELKTAKRVFSTAQEFEEQVVDVLNSITETHGLSHHYFTHNGFNFNNKYCSLACTGCKHKVYVWFTFAKGADGSITNIKFERTPYGSNMHRDLEKHVATQILHM